MSETNLNCPKCSAQMEGGFIVDYGYAAVKPSDWVEGDPVKSFWHGTKIKGKKQYQVITYRCVRCGYLESYARDEKDGAPDSSSLFT